MNRDQKQGKISGPLAEIRTMAEAMDKLCREIKAGQLRQANRVVDQLNGREPEDEVIAPGLEPIDAPKTLTGRRLDPAPPLAVRGAVTLPGDGSGTAN